MDFTIPPELESLRKRVATFVDERLIPLEADPHAHDAHENIADTMLQEQCAAAREQDLWCLQSSKEIGGGGLDKAGIAVVYEEMNCSIFGPVVFNAAAPDDGNMMVLEAPGTAQQKDRWLMPLVRGEVRSAFAMTEPHPGGGSDPGMMQTSALKCGDRYIVNGHKWIITRAESAEHFVLIARTSDDERRGYTAFLFHRDDPGWEITRRISIMGPEEHGGYCELEFNGLEIPVANVLHDAADVGIQINGARGYSRDTVLEWVYRYARQARLVDGADEVHRMVLSRELRSTGSEFWSWEVE